MRPVGSGPMSTTTAPHARAGRRGISGAACERRVEPGRSYDHYITGGESKRNQAGVGEQICILDADGPLAGVEQFRFEGEHHAALEHGIGAALEWWPLVQFEADAV